LGKKKLNCLFIPSAKLFQVFVGNNLHEVIVEKKLEIDLANQQLFPLNNHSSN